jgi:hypothetical protein
MKGRMRLAAWTEEKRPIAGSRSLGAMSELERGVSRERKYPAAAGQHDIGAMRPEGIGHREFVQRLSED